MPFKSEKQRKWMWANEPEMAKKWEDEEDEAVDENSIGMLRDYVNYLLFEYVSGAEQDPKSMAANESQRQVILDLLSDYDDLPEVAEFLDVVSGADRLATTAPMHDRYFTQEDVDHVVTALEATDRPAAAKKLDDIDFREYFR
jgi:hypothetical protein